MASNHAEGFQEIEFGSEQYGKECRLRQEVLRLPLGLDLFSKDLSIEVDQKHFGIFENHEIVACLVVSPQSSDGVKLRQMAVAPEVQGSGYGRRLIGLVEGVLLKEGYSSVVLHARESAMGFYRKLGYRALAGLFHEAGIPHRKMIKDLEGA